MMVDTLLPCISLATEPCLPESGWPYGPFRLGHTFNLFFVSVTQSIQVFTLRFETSLYPKAITVASFQMMALQQLPSFSHKAMKIKLLVLIRIRSYLVNLLVNTFLVFKKSLCT